MENNIYHNENQSDVEYNFQTGIGPMTDKILNNIIDKFNTVTVREKITDKFLDPVTDIINQKIQPYIYIGLGLYSIIIILLLIIIYFIMFKKKL
jgi:hypothetical protein